MGLRLYNTLTKTKEDFVPIDPAHVRMYVCGPTVYDFAHIGNARPVIVFDVLYRLLRHLYGPEHVTYVRNITDVDDKINQRAARDYPDVPPVEAIRTLTETTYDQFRADVAALGCLDPVTPRATEHIAEMVELIEALIAKGHAYAAEGHVLFHVPSMPAYGRLARRSLDDMIAGARVDVAPYKRDPMDFVLWKPSTADEPGWESPWGRGRPGWHIECSAMSFATLIRPFGGGFTCDDPRKNTFDIHGGGIDLVFPHHENEIAQTCCAFGTERMANIWMHNGFLQVEGEKMSKSLGNFVTIRELLNKPLGAGDWHGDVLRFTMLKTHYRQPIDWTENSVWESFHELHSWRKALSFAIPSDPDPRFVEALQDDLNTPAAIAVLRDLFKSGRNYDQLGWRNSADTFAACLRLIGLDRLVDTYSKDARAYREQLKFDVARAVAEIEAKETLADAEKSSVDTALVNTMIAARLAARKAKNFAESDRIRDELAAMGLVLKDGKDPATGEPVTTWEVKR